jgi:hypothetical protein
MPVNTNDLRNYADQTFTSNGEGEITGPQVREAFRITADVVDREVPGQAAEAARDAAIAARTAAETAEAGAIAARTGAEAALAALAAGAPIVTTLTAASPDGKINLLMQDAGLQVYEVVAGEWVLRGWLTGPEFDTVALLLASAAATLGPVGQIVEGGGFRYQVAATDATDHHVTTAGGVKLYVVDGAHPAAFAFSPADALAGDTLPALQSIAAYQAQGRKLAEYDQSPWRLLAARLWQHVDQGVDFNLIVKGDSTGDSTAEWVYLFATLLAQSAPTHSVKYRLYTDASGWGAETDISTGTGAGVIYIHNASVPGSTDRYFQGGKGVAVDSITPTGGYHGQIANFGHNGGSVAVFTEKVWTEYHVEGLAVFKERQPAAVLVATQQNPKLGTDVEQAVSLNSHRGMANACRLLGVGMLSVSDAFLSLGDFSPLMADNTHPNAAGMKLWAGLAFLALRRPSILSLGVSQNDNFFSGVNILPNPNFAVPAAQGAALPGGWSATGVTVTRDTTYTDKGPWSLKLVSDGGVASPFLTNDLGAEFVKQLRGKWITLTARTRYASGNTARMQLIETGTGSVSSSNRSPNGTEGQGGWSEIILHHYVGLNATSLQIRYLCGVANVAGSEVYLDFITLAVGLIPALPNYASTPEKTGYLFAAANCGIVAGFDGTLTVTGRNLAVTGRTGTTRVYINIPITRQGQRIRASWIGQDLDPALTHNIFVRLGANGGVTSVFQLNARRGEIVFASSGAAMSLMLEVTGTADFALNDFTVDFA